MMKRRFFWTPLLAIALSLFLGSSGIVWADSVPPVAAESDLGPTTARFVPEQSPLFVSLHNPKHLPIGGAQVVTNVSQWPQALLATAEVDYDRDLKPYVNDELTFALTGPVRQHDYLFALTTRGATESQTCIEKLWQRQIKAGQPLSFEQSGDVSIISTQFRTPKPLEQGITGLEPFPNLATAIVEDRYILLSNSSAVLKSVIDGSQSQNLSTTSSYQEAVTNLQQKQKDGLIYVDLSAFSSSAAPPYQSVAIQLGKTRQGLVAETVLVADEAHQGTLVDPAVTAPLQSLNFIPASSPFVLSGVNLQQLWNQMSADLKGYDLLDQWVRNSLKQGSQHWSVNLPRDVIPNVTGEYTLAILPDSDSRMGPSDSFLNSDWLFVHDNDNQKLTQVIDQGIQKQNIGVIPYALDDHQVSAWAHLVTSTDSSAESASTMMLNAEVMGAFAIEDDYKIMATSLDALKQGLSGDSISKQKDLQAALATLPAPNQGYLYINWPMMRPLLERKLPKLKQLESLIGPWSQNLTDVMLTNYGETPTVQRSQFLFRFTDS